MSLRSTLVKQFKQPTGILGQAAGFIMAKRASNRQRNTWTVNLLKLEPHHQVLEIGCGPGLGLKACAQQVTEGQVIGIDHSSVMVQQAQRRLSAEIKQGRVAVTLAGLDQLTSDFGGADRIYSLNVVQFFPDIEDAFQQIYTCLNNHGLSATTFQPRTKNPTREQTLSMALKIQSAMNNAGFRDIQINELPLNPAPAVCVTGVKAPLAV